MRSSILQSFVHCRGGLHRSIGRLQYHVFRGTTISNQGCFHSKVALEAGKIHNANSTFGPNSKTFQGGQKDCFIIRTSRPGVTKYRDVLNELSLLRSTSIVDDGQGRNLAVVILATPTFATWLESKDFMSEMLDKVFPANSGAVQDPDSSVMALVAVVDGIFPTRHEETKPSMEGFALLTCDHQITLPGLWQHEYNISADNDSYNPRPSITFRLCSNSSIEGGGLDIDVGVPLANTMFRNGRTSTLLASEWKRFGDTGVFEKIHQLEKQSAMIYIAPSHVIVPLHLETSLVPLTPIRRVVSGLGNILRQVVNANGDVVSASQELEASVDSYLESRLLDKQAVAVWALVIPDSMHRMSESIMADDSKHIRAAWTATMDSNMRSYVGYWLLQGSSVTLHRVLSGGGGWGLKQGLLSLDPETTLFSSADTHHNFNLTDSLDNNQIQALGNIAKPGSWVQFLILDNFVPGPPRDTINAGTVGPEFELVGNLSFGCVASTVDEMPQSQLGQSELEGDNNVPHSVEGHYGKFGAISEAGIFIRAAKNGVVTSSKIDAPNSEFCLTMIPRKESRSEM